MNIKERYENRRMLPSIRNNQGLLSVMDGPSPDALLLKQNAVLGSKSISWLIT